MVCKIAAILCGPQCVKRTFPYQLGPTDAIQHWGGQSSFVQVMACCLFSTKPLLKSILFYNHHCDAILITGRTQWTFSFPPFNSKLFVSLSVSYSVIPEVFPKPTECMIYALDYVVHSAAVVCMRRGLQMYCEWVYWDGSTYEYQ